jgi:phospholipid/cholesterol/gamma-HCH transport system substrate-binding protein
MGRENDLKSLIQQLDHFIGQLHEQTNDIVDATGQPTDLVGQFDGIQTRR